MAFALDPSDFAPYGVTNDESPTNSARLDWVQIHDIFRYENFARPYRYDKLNKELKEDTDTFMDADIIYERLPRSTYNRCLPSFRLASLFLRHSAYFLPCIRNSPVAELTAGGVYSRRKRYFRNQKVSQFTAADRRQIESQLKDLAERLRFVTRLENTLYSQVRAVSHLVEDWWLTPPDEVRYFVSLARNFARIDSAVSLHHSTRTRLQFGLAVDLVHELSHLLHWERFQNLTSSPPYPHDIDFDPCFNLSDPVKELGDAWEHYFFRMKPTMCLSQEDWTTDLFLDQTTGRGNQKPLYPGVSGPMMHKKASQVTPFTNPNCYQTRSENIEKFFDVNAWTAFDRNLADPNVANPLQIQLTPSITRITAEKYDGSGAGEMHAYAIQKKSCELYAKFLRMCAEGTFNPNYELYGEYAEVEILTRTRT